MTDKNTMSVGVRFCSNCENNLRCAECAYKEKYETLAQKHDYVLDEAKRMKSKLDDLKRDTIPKLENSLERANKYGFETDKHNQQLKAEVACLNKEIDRLSQLVLYNDGNVSDLERDLFNAKSEAIKEFAEKVKKYFNPDSSYDFRKWIDNLVKEMVGEG